MMLQPAVQPASSSPSPPKVSPYASATRCPVLGQHIVLRLCFTRCPVLVLPTRACYAMSGTERAYRATSTRTASTDSRRLPPLSAYGCATRCPVLT
eukprot:888866-Rhodomonas_salina.2